jgi:hypothetical protein
MTATARLPALDHVTLPYAGSVDIEIGDAVFLGPTLPAQVGITAGSAYPASSQVDQGNAAKNQRCFAKNFAGMAKERHLSTEAAGTVDVVPVWVGDITVTSQVWKAGMLVGIAENAGVNGILSQSFVQVTDPDLAIGQCVQDSGGVSIATIRAVLYSRLFSFGGGDVRMGSLVEAITVAGFTDDLAASGHYDTVGKLPPGACVLWWEFNCTGIFGGDTTAVIKVGDSGATGRYSADTAQSVFTAGRKGSASVATTSFVATEESARVTVTGGADFTSIITNGLGAGTLTIVYGITVP